MFKQFLLYLVASLIVVLIGPYIHHALIYLYQFYTYIDNLIAPIFNDAGLGQFVHRLCVLIFVPIIIVGIPALIYRAVRGSTMPHYLAITWCLWLILLLSILLMHGG